MSEKNSESFEEAISKIKLTSEYYLTARDMELVYNYQQKKIDELEASSARMFSDNGELSEKLQAAEEENRILREAVLYCAENAPRRFAVMCQQALEKVQRGKE